MINIILFENHKSHFIVTSVALIIAGYAIILSNWSLAMCLVLIASGYRWIIGILGLSKVAGKQSRLLIFEDASVQCRFGNGVILRGFLEQQQWCTSKIAVLKVSMEGKIYHFAAFSLQQTENDSFRRLNTWLRHDFYRDSGGLQVSGN